MATTLERRRPLPVDSLVSEPIFASTHAITIDAPPEYVWPWIAQMGAGRAGWYSWDAIDNGGRPSATSILPTFQTVVNGDVMPAIPGATDAFIVAAVDPPVDDPQRLDECLDDLDRPDDDRAEGVAARRPQARLTGRLARQLGESVRVGCHHHQSVAAHPGFEATAWAADGSLEAMERPGPRFCLAVQWHPEVRDDHSLFAALVEAAAERSATMPG